MDVPATASWVLCLLPLALLVERGWALRWVADDGYITLRVVDQLMHGNGPVFNAGERVEASTSTLWVYVLAIADAVLPLSLEWIAVVLGIVLTVGGAAMAMVASRRLQRTVAHSALLVPAGLLVLVAVKPIWIFTTSGLEGGLTTAWLGACLWMLVRWAEGDGSLAWWSAVVLGLGPLIRPDVGVYSAVFLTVVAAVTWRQSRRAVLRLLVQALALPAAYQVFRMGYYGLLVPNPAIAKEASTARWDRGWVYLGATIRPYVLWFPLAVLAVGAYLPLLRQLRQHGRSRSMLLVAGFLVSGLVHALYIVRVGGDFIESRLLLPSLFAIVAPVSVVPLRRREAIATLVVPWAIVSGLFLRSHHDDVVVANSNPVTVEDYHWGDERIEAFRSGVFYQAEPLDARPPGDRQMVVAAYGIGVVGYALGPDAYVLDLLGLADPFTSHLKLERRGYPAHEKPLPPPWIVARGTAPGGAVTAEDLPLVIFGTLPLDDASRGTFEERVAIARATLECPELQAFFDTHRAPLTPSRFLKNVVGSFRNTTLRIAPEPEDTAEQFCR